MKPSIFIGLPNLGTLETVLSSRLREWYACGKYRITMTEATGMRPLEIPVNQILALFLETDCEWLFLINSDECLPFDALDRLMAHDVDVVAPLGLRWDRKHGPLPCIGVREGGSNDELLRHFDNPADVSMTSGRARYIQPRSGFSGLRRVDRIGNSGMLLKRKVVEAVPLGTFRMHMSEDRTDIYATEDFAWCDAIREAGFEIYCDCDLLLDHYRKVNLARVAGLQLEARDKGRQDVVAAIKKLQSVGATPEEALKGVIEWLESTQPATSR